MGTVENASTANASSYGDLATGDYCQLGSGLIKTADVFGSLADAGADLIEGVRTSGTSGATGLSDLAMFV